MSISEAFTFFSTSRGPSAIVDLRVSVTSLFSKREPLVDNWSGLFRFDVLTPPYNRIAQPQC